MHHLNAIMKLLRHFLVQIVCIFIIVLCSKNIVISCVTVAEAQECKGEKNANIYVRRSCMHKNVPFNLIH